MYELIVLREILFFIMVVIGLFGVTAAVVLMFVDRKKIDRKLDEAMNEVPTAEKIAGRLLDRLGETDKPLILNVSQERLIEKVADEMKRRSKENQ